MAFDELGLRDIYVGVMASYLTTVTSVASSSMVVSYQHFLQTFWNFCIWSNYHSAQQLDYENGPCRVQRNNAKGRRSRPQAHWAFDEELLLGGPKQRIRHRRIIAAHAGVVVDEALHLFFGGSCLFARGLQPFVWCLRVRCTRNMRVGTFTWKSMMHPLCEKTPMKLHRTIGCVGDFP